MITLNINIIKIRFFFLCLSIIIKDTCLNYYYIYTIALLAKISWSGAMSYAELGTVVNKSGGEFSFYQSAFADMHKFWGPLPSFIYSWVSIMYVRPAEVAIIILTFAEYFIRPFSIMTSMTPENEHMVKKTVSILALGKCSVIKIFFYIYIFSLSL